MPVFSVEHKSVWHFALRAAVSIVLLWLSLRHVAVQDVVGEIRAADPVALAGALFVLCGITAIASLRWSVILRALGTSRGLRVTYPLSLIGLFFSQLLPAGIGADLVRVWLVCRTGLSLRTALSSILGDRLMGLLAILLIVTFELPSLRRIIGAGATFSALTVTLVAGYAAFLTIVFLDLVAGRLRRFRVVREITHLSGNVRTVFGSWAWIPVLACSAAIQLCYVLAAFVVCRSLHLPVALESLLLVVPFANVLQSLPISVAGWGIRESFFVVALALVGTPAPVAVAVSVLLGLLTIASSLPGGVLWLVRGAGTPPRDEGIHPVAS